MNKIYMINGSPKGKKDNNSQYFIDELSNLLNKDNIQIKQASTLRCSREEIYPQLMESEAIIFVSPLYVDSLPSSLLNFIVGLESYIKQAELPNNTFPKIYAIFNCGFFEGHQNKIALDIVKNFCNKIGFTWRFGIGVGAGEFMGGTKVNISLRSKVKQDTFNALIELKNDIESNNTTLKNNIFTSPKMPRFLFQLAGNIGWIQQAKVNKLKIGDIYTKPCAK